MGKRIFASRWGRAVGLAVIGVVSMASGCHRPHYRMQADRDVYGIVAEKAADPRWAFPEYTIDMDPRGRYFDPYDPDRPPMPPDDPTSHQFMHCVYCMKGWPHWHDNGDRIDLENPVWREHLGEIADVNERGEVVLSVDAALRLAYVHSPNYQNQLETLYLSALDVSAERFRFDTQFFGGNDTFYNHRGGLSPPSLVRSLSGNSVSPASRRADTNSISSVTDFSLRRRFATAGELLVGFANSFVWEFSSGDANLTTSLANFSLVQPLLRGAGQDVALEQLTIVERGLLANLRAYQRYRQGFYTQVAIGESGVAGPQRRGGFFGGTGLTGFTGQGSGGLGGVGAATGFGRGGGTAAAGGGGAGFAGGGAGQVGGYIGLLQQLQQIRNTQDSLNLQLRTLAMLEAYLAAGVINLTQVDQFRQNVETERATLLQQQNSLVNTLDSFKVNTLGLPPDLSVHLDDSLIQQFQFVDPKATALQNRIADFQSEVGKLPKAPDVTSWKGLLDRVSELLGQVDERFTDIQKDLRNMEEHSPTREQSMTDTERSLFRKDRDQLVSSLAEMWKRFEARKAELQKLNSGLVADSRQAATKGLIVWLDDTYRLAEEMILVQARARLESVVVDPIPLRPEEAIQIALTNRLDIMNNRAALVDSWRLIAFNADALQANLNVVFSGDISTARNNPFSFRAPTSNLRAGLQFDAPFTRLLERNNYRQSLIDYQRDRREFIQSLDGVYRDLRTLLRELEQLRVNLEIQRRAVVISIRRVDLTQEQLNQPQATTQLGPTAAIDLLTALSDLRNTQNNFMSVWLNYYAARMRLMRELGIMALDEEGRWIDTPIPHLEEAAPGTDAAPPEVPAQWYELVDATSGAPLSRGPVVEVGEAPPDSVESPLAARR